jgi:DNA replication protein DnaC
VAHNCAVCQDAGYKGWKTPVAGYSLKECEFCECEAGQRAHGYWQRKEAAANQRRLEELFTGAGIPLHFRDLTLDSLIATAGDDPGKQEAIAAVREFIADGLVTDPVTGKRKPGIIISGQFGCGKTGILTPALREAVAMGKSGLWIEMYEFVAAIQSAYRRRDEYSNRPEEKGVADAAEQRLSAAQRAGIILLDDFGDVERIQPETDDRRRLLYSLINYRHNEALPMLITTNCDGAQLAHQFGGRTIERVMESCAWVEMGGRNLRSDH